MSPPSFDMDKKLPENVSVTVDSGKAASNTKAHYKCIGISIVIGTLILVGGILAAVAVHHSLDRKESFDTISNVKGRRVPEHVRVDYQNEIIFISNEKDGPIDGLNALHDYNRRLLAFKDLTNNKCYIDKLDQTFQEGLNTWRSFEDKERIPKPRYFRYIREPIDTDVLRTFGGKHIADHCQDVPSHWIVALPKEFVEANKDTFLNKTAEFICFPDTIIPELPRPFPQPGPIIPIRPVDTLQNVEAARV